MPIEQVPFRKYKLDEEGQKPDIFTIRLNQEERQWLDKAKTHIQQPKDSSALKLLAEIGAQYILHDPLSTVFLKAFYRNLANNARLGIPVKDPTLDTNVTDPDIRNPESK